MASRKTARKRLEAYGSFVFKVDAWRPTYSFSSTPSPLNQGAYWDHLALTIRGACISPKERADRIGDLILLGDRRFVHPLMTGQDDGRDPTGVGTLTMRGKETSYLGSIPWDAMTSILPLLTSGDLKLIRFDGEALYRGRARIRSISFEREIGPVTLSFRP